ncbi:hypothetical protein [Leifsonia sp. P73]|uniref:hypothetical protein n=1 Tax=Leifsonia sp. P73 TaxID=3423959 RepID=UPI003DA46A1C
MTKDFGSAELDAIAKRMVEHPTLREARAIEAWRVAENVASLPKAVHDDRLPPLIQQACLEMFFVHVRALLEFLEVRTPKRSDFSARDIAPSYRSPTGEELAALNARWEQASQQVLHFSKSRVDHSRPWESQVDVSFEALTAIADEVLTVWDRYAELARTPAAPKRDDFNLFHELRTSPD